MKCPRPAFGIDPGMFASPLGFVCTVLLALALSLGANCPPCDAQTVTPSSGNSETGAAPKEVPPWERVPRDMRAAQETNKQALDLITAVYEARFRRAEVEGKFTPKLAPPDKTDPLSGPNDLAISPLLQDFGQGVIWLSIILSAKPSDLSPRLQTVQQQLLAGLQQSQKVKPEEARKEIKKPLRARDLEDSDTAHDVQRVLQAELNYQAVVSQLRSLFPSYAELYLHQSPRVLNRLGEPTVFDLCDPVINTDPIVKNERMQASLMVKVYRPDEHNFKVVNFWLYRNIEDPEIFVPRALYSDKGRDVTRNSEGHWDASHMPPRTFSSLAYVSHAVTVLNVRFVDGEPVMSGRSVPAGRHRSQPVDLSQLDLTHLEPAVNGALDVSVPSFPVDLPNIPTLPALALTESRLGRDYMPHLREPYEFRTQAEYEAYLTGVRESLAALQQQAAEMAALRAAAAPPSHTDGAPAGTAPSTVPLRPLKAPVVSVNVERLNAVFLNPQQPAELDKLNALARDSLKQYPNLYSVANRNLVIQAIDRTNASLRSHDPAAQALQRELLKVREVSVYFLASENTSASWRGPDDETGHGGIIVILPNRYYFDPDQFYPSLAGALINQPVTSGEVAALSKVLVGSTAQTAAIRQFTIETDYLDHGWDENGDMRKWPDEEVDFFKHLPDAIRYLKPRFDAMPPERSSLLDAEITYVETWWNSLGEGPVTVNFGLYKGKTDPPPPKVDANTRTILIACTADEYIQSEQRANRWSMLAKLVEGFNGLSGARFDKGMTGAIYDVLNDFARDKDNKLMIAWRLNSDLPAKPSDLPLPAAVARASQLKLASLQNQPKESPVVLAANDPPPAPGNDPAPPPSVTVSDPNPATASEPQQPPALPQVADARSVPSVPQLTERSSKPDESTRVPKSQWADPEFGNQVFLLIAGHMTGPEDSSVRSVVLQTMMDRLIIVRDPNPGFQSKVSALDLREPTPTHFDFTVNKTAYFDALFTLGQKDKSAQDVIWSSFETNIASVEYAVTNHDFGSLYTALQSDLAAVEKRYATGGVVSADIFNDPQFKALLPYYTTFWSNWQYAGERARFQYLHDHVTSKRLRQLAEEAAARPETKAVAADLLHLADSVDLFYGDIGHEVNGIRAVDARAGQEANSQDANAIRNELTKPTWQHVYQPPEPLQLKVDYSFTQLLSTIQKVEDPSGKKIDYRDIYRRAYMIRLMLDAWNRNDPVRRERLLAGEWAGSDLRFILAILAEIQAKRVGSDLDNAAIVKLISDMPWIADPAFDLTNGAFGRLPDTLKPQPVSSGQLR